MESPLNTVSGITLTAVVPKPSEQQCSTTMRTKAEEALISQTCPWTGWLDDVAIQQDANRVSCQVTIVVVVTGVDVSSTGSRNFNGEFTLGTLSRSRFS